MGFYNSTSWPMKHTMIFMTFIWLILFYFISIEKLNEKGKYTDGIEILTFLLPQNEWVSWDVDNIDFKGCLTYGSLIIKCVLRVPDSAAFMVKDISLRESFWVVKTWQALVQKWLVRIWLHIAKRLYTAQDCITF